MALARQGKSQEAESHWRAALKIRPGYSFATGNLEDLRRPVAERNGPFLLPLENMIPHKMIGTLFKALEKLGRKPSVNRQREAALVFNEQCPGFVSAIPLLLRIGDDKSREVAVKFVGLFNTPELCEALREFAQSDRGTDARRLNALHELPKLGVEVPSPVRFFIKGRWTEINNLEIEINDEPIEMLSSNVSPAMDRGHAAMHRGDFHAAEQAFRAALKLEAGLVPAHNNLAAVKLAQGQFTEAEKILRQVLVLDENNVTARSNLARLALMHNDDQAAIDWLWPLRVSRRFHSSEYAAMTGVDFELSLRKGDLAAAKQLLQSIKQVSPECPHITSFQMMLRRKELELSATKLVPHGEEP